MTAIDDRRVLAIAVASGRVGHVLLEQRRVINLGMTRSASTGEAAARSFALQKINDLEPEVVLTEKVLAQSRKGDRAKTVIATIAEVASLAQVEHLSVVRGRSHENRFDEATDLARRYPALVPYLPPRRRPWEPEPKALIYFEALALFESAFGVRTRAA